MTPRIRKSSSSLRADLVLKNAYVWTVDHQLARAEAVAIRGNEILAVGGTAEVVSLKGPKTMVYDLGGKLVLPGFNDSHTHFVMVAAKSPITFSAYGVETLEEIQNRLRKCLAANPDSEWVFGARWTPKNRAGDFPSRTDLDIVEDRRPVAIIDIDYHTAWVNSPGLEALGYDENTPEQVGGTILREDGGFPSGILFESAIEPILMYTFEQSYESFSDAIASEAEKLSRLGITSLSSSHARTEDLERCGHMAQEGRLPIRINHWPLLAEGLENARELQERYRGNENVFVGGLKTIFDGVPGNRTAWMLDPYADSPDEFGYPTLEPGELEKMVVAADAEGFQMITHAIGDRAIRETLDIYEKAATINGKRDSRHRIEHAEMPHPNDQKRYLELGVVPSHTPLHLCTTDLDDFLIERIGPRREVYTQPWRSMVEQGIRICFGTDYPAVNMPNPNPLTQIFAAVTRIPPMIPDREPWHPEQALSVEQAIQCYTLNSAYAEFMDQRKGSITPGKLADLSVLSQNILEIDPHQILETEVLMTIFDGKVAFENL